MQKYSKDEILKYLDTKVFARDIIFMDETGTTLDDIKNYYKEGGKEGAVAVAKCQTKGRGRNGRSYVSNDGGVYMSFLLTPDLPFEKIPVITLLSGLCVKKAIESTADVSCGIKWPNDCLINGRKVCGILAEATMNAGGIENIVVGIGINVNNESFPDEIKDIATSLYLETGKRFERSRVIAAFFNEFEKLYKRLGKEGFSAFKDEYIKSSVTVGKNVVLLNKENKNVFVLGFNENGALIVRDENGKTFTVESGEVSVRERKL